MYCVPYIFRLHTIALWMKLQEKKCCLHICACTLKRIFVFVSDMTICFCTCIELKLSLCMLAAGLFICGSKVARTWALSIKLCHLLANPLAAILRCIYVSRAEWRLAVTCVREVVALMEFFSWQSSRQYWYVFKILARNNTCFCSLLGQVGLFLSLMAPGGPGDSTRS